ncbi:GTPase HflX [Horticoccus sp. 23ND18S-11]|uniref:GTPase HflX n=1 Tax=Horticoccus sp. 23ND18S-11 TaxID=3391832 RepID=UPI0039C8ED59
MADFLTDKPAKLERAFLVGVQTPEMPAGEAAELLTELKELVENLRITVAHSELVNLRRPTPSLFLGSGKAEEIITAAKALDADVIVFDEALSPAQQRNWEELSGLAVIDRQEVILEIFSDRAHTREATLQVALARMEYSLPRLTRAWAHLSRQRGKGKMGGEGETQLEQDRRIVRDRITHLKTELASVVKQRNVQRRKRQRVPIPTCAIVGYTNAGKSTLLNTLTGAEVLAADKLFATLDPTTRQLVLRGNQKLLVTDTVGFIRRLPHGLVEAFKATLEEVVVADFLVHVIDVTNPNFEQHHATTISVLGELGAGSQTMVTVFNKVDAATPEMIARARRLVPEALFVSALTREGLDVLEARCLELIAEAHATTELLVPHQRYDVIARLHAVGHVQSEEQLDDGVRLFGRYPPTQAAFFAPFVVKS